jgi:hypothetical protein
MTARQGGGEKKSTPMQTEIAGAERISDRAMAERRMAQPLRPRAAQMRPDAGLFDLGARRQVGLFEE